MIHNHSKRRRLDRAFAKLMQARDQADAVQRTAKARRDHQLWKRSQLIWQNATNRYAAALAL